MARATLSVIMSALNPLSTMQARKVELSIRIATKMCFLKYSNGRVATTVFSAGRNAKRERDDANLLAPNANTAIPQRITSHRAPRGIFKGNSFAVHPAARQPESRYPKRVSSALISINGVAGRRDKPRGASRALRDPVPRAYENRRSARGCGARKFQPS